MTDNHEAETVRYVDLIASKPDEPVFVVRHPADADALRGYGLLAVARPECWDCESAHSLRDRETIFIVTRYGYADNWANEDRNKLKNVCKSVKLFMPIGFAGKTPPRDLVDYVARQEALDLPYPEFIREARGFDESDWVNERPRVAVEPIRDDEDDDSTPLPEVPWPRPPKDEAFRGIIGEYSKMIGEQTECDPNACLVQGLVSFGNAAKRSAYVQIGAVQHHTNVNAVIVGESGDARKGQSFSETAAPFAIADPVWRDTRVLGGLSTGEGLIFSVRDEIRGREAIRDKDKRIVDYQDVVVDPGVDDKRLLVYEPEFGSVLQVMKRDGNRLSAVIRQAFDGGHLGIVTKTTPYRATGAHVSILGHITKAELDSLLSEVDVFNGFANRFLWCCTRRSRLCAFGGEVKGSAEYERRLTEALASAKKTGKVGWTQSAMNFWRDVYPILSRGRPGPLGGITTRAAANTLRLALIYALAAGKYNLEKDDIESALAVWAYCEASAALIFGDSTGNPVADKILAALRESDAGLTKSQIRSQVFQRNTPAARIKEALSILAKYRLVREERVTNTGGAPAFRYHAINAPDAISHPGRNGVKTEPGAYSVNGVKGVLRHDGESSRPESNGVVQGERANGDACTNEANGVPTVYQAPNGQLRERFEL